MDSMKFRTALILVLLLEIAVGILAFFHYGMTLEGLQATTRFSGRLSLAIFSLIFLFQGHQKINLEALLSDHCFLIFAIAHGIHLIELLSFVSLSGAPLIPYRVAGGFLAYAFIFAMPWLHELLRQGRLGEKRFSMLSNVYRYYVLFIFFMTYFSRVQGKVPNAGGTHTEHLILMGWVLSLLVFRPLIHRFYRNDL